MKLLAVCVYTLIMSGCVAAGSNNPHEDSASSPPPKAGPELCVDGSVPPCTPRG